MKLFYATVFGLLVSATTFAQKGSFYVGGQVGFSNSTNTFDPNVNGGTTSETKSSSWSFSPEVGTFLTDNVQLGVGLNIVGTSNDNFGVDQDGSAFGGTVYSRYFFGEGSKAFRPFVGANLSYLSGKQDQVTFNFGLPANVLQTDFNTFGANINAGFAYALSPKVTVVGSLGVLGFDSTTYEIENSPAKRTINNFGFDLNSLGNRFTVGMYLTL
jgi:outer membrane protein W